MVGPQGPNFPDYLYWLHFGNGFFVPATMMGIVALPNLRAYLRRNRRASRLSARDEGG